MITRRVIFIRLANTFNAIENPVTLKNRNIGHNILF